MIYQAIQVPMSNLDPVRRYKIGSADTGERTCMGITLCVVGIIGIGIQLGVLITAIFIDGYEVNVVDYLGWLIVAVCIVELTFAIISMNDYIFWTRMRIFFYVSIWASLATLFIIIIASVIDELIVNSGTTWAQILNVIVTSSFAAFIFSTPLFTLSIMAYYLYLSPPSPTYYYSPMPHKNEGNTLQYPSLSPPPIFI